MGNNVKIYGKIIISGNPLNIEIGDNVTLNAGVILNTHEKIKIGNNSRLSNGVQLHTTYLDVESRRHIDKPIILKENIWLASNVVVNANSTIGKNSIVGANSFINGTVSSNEFWAGSPAKYIKGIKSE
jgi:maltose O-acetyltransferase